MKDEELQNLIQRRRVLQGLGAAGVVALAGCAGDGGDGDGDGGDGGDGGTGGDGGDGGTPTPQKGGKLMFAQVKSPVEFDPVVLNDVPSGEVADQIFEGLYHYDESTGHVPVLAAGEPEVNDAGDQYVVELVDGATFQNGDPVTAEDVKYSFMALREEETENANEVTMIDTIETVDEKTVQFNLKFPFASFSHTLHRSIVPKSVRENDKQAFNKENPVGSGPFEFDDWTEGEFARVVRYDDYWGDTQPHLDEIEFVPVEEATTRVTTLQNGENDVIKEIPPQQWSTVESIEDASIDQVPGTGYFYLAFNCNQGPTTDPQVREAIDYVFSMDQAVSNFVEPTGVRQYSPVPKAVAEDWEFPLDEWEGIPHDKNLDEAKSLLDDAGVPDNYSWQIIVPPDDKREQIGVTVANGLKELDYNANVQRLDWGAFLEKYVSGNESDYNMYTLGWAGTPDPDSFTYYLLARTDDVLGVTNGTFWGNNSQAGKDAAEKFVQARETPDREERRQLYIEGITTALEERPHLPAYNLKNSYGVRNYVKDFTSHPVGQFSIFSTYNNTWKQQQ